MPETLSILSRSGRRKAVVTATERGAIADYYEMRVRGGGEEFWVFSRQTELKQPSFEAALGVVEKILNAQPMVGVSMGGKG